MKFAMPVVPNVTSVVSVKMLSTRLTLMLFLGLLCLVTRASTPGEDEMCNAPMRHQTGGPSNDTVLVHMTRLQGYMESPPGNTAMLAKLKRDIQKCVEDKQRDGLTSNPPKAWPDFITAQRWDSYAANNRQILYTTILYHAINYLDCSVTEAGGTHASLISLKGKCEIDFTKRTARGQCDALAHSDAPVPRYKTIPKLPESDPMLRKIRSDPAYATLAKIMDRQSATGERKTILGLECETGINGLFPQSTICSSRGGSFATCDSFDGPPQSCMLLEISTKEGQTGQVLHAIEARLDTRVNTSIFAPYLAGGFEITNVGARK